LLLIVVLPLALTIVGIMLLNRLNHVRDQPEYSREIDTDDKLAAEREANHHDSHLQRARILERQRSVCDFALGVGPEFRGQL
jgi:hypothetical protein